MTEAEVIITSLICLLGGGLIGVQIGMILIHEKIKKRLNSKCANCKHFKQCLGFWEKLDDEGNCRIYSEGEPEKIKTLEEKLEVLDSCICEGMYELEEEISRLEEKVFSEQEIKQKPKTGKKK